MNNYGRGKRFTVIDYGRAFTDPSYGRFIHDDADEYNTDGEDSDIDYSSDEDISALVQSLPDYTMRAAYRTPKIMTDYQRNYDVAAYSPRTSERTPQAVPDFAQRFVDLLLQMDINRNKGSTGFIQKGAQYDIDAADKSALERKTSKQKRSHDLCTFIYNGMIGLDSVIGGPFGPRSLVYCDFVASGKPLKFIEQYIKEYVLPMYANTHSESSDAAMQTNKFREDAREIIRDCVNGSDDDIVIFVGSGSTSAIAKMIQVMKSSNNIDFSSVIVMVATYEHHSNLLPWENAKVGGVVRIPLNKNGVLDMNDLSKQCKHYHSKGYIIIGSISAASNVTGILTDIDQVAEIIHHYDGYVFFDYACGAPYLRMNMNPRSRNASKDAIFISVHKFVGGPQTPGLLIAKRFLFKNAIPSNPSGGTVAFVSRSIVQYAEDPVAREEGGTPEIIGSIRAGLTFKLKAAVTEDYIHARETELAQQFINHFRNNRLITILGSLTALRLPIFSFIVHHQAGKRFIHHNFIGLLLNDLFGLQSRPGCACAGPYAMELLGVDESIAIQSAKYFTKDCSFESLFRHSVFCLYRKNQYKITILKQGFVRINLPYFYPQQVINFIINAVEFVVNYGWYFLPQYTYSAETGFWMHRHFNKSFSSLKDISYSDLAMNVETYEKQERPPEDLFVAARKELKRAKEIAKGINFSSDPPILLDDGDEHLRWFLLPHEAAYYIRRLEAFIDSPFFCNDKHFRGIDYETQIELL